MSLTDLSAAELLSLLGTGKATAVDVATAFCDRIEAVDPKVKAFLHYRRKSGSKTGVLPDFFIGAHAAVAGIPLLTRDARRNRTYFPKLALISPDAGQR